MSKSNDLLLAENTKISKSNDLLSKSNDLLLAENTKISKSNDLLSKSNKIEQLGEENNVKVAIIAKKLLTLVCLLALFSPSKASAQLIPQPWVSVGGKDGEVTYAVGARALNFGVEVGTGPDGATGVDVLKFISLPVISPYVGVGLYSEDKGVAVSGGVQVGATNNVFVGAGYNSIRGFNGQLGVRF